MSVLMSYKTFDLSVWVGSENNWKGKIKLDKKYEFTKDTFDELEKKFHELVDDYLDTPRMKTQFSIVYKNSTLKVTPLVDGRFSAVCGEWIFPLYDSLDSLVAAFQERVEEYIHSGCISIASATHLSD